MTIDIPDTSNEREIEKCIEWLNLHRKTKSFNLHSYYAKHLVERWYGDCISNDSFKHAVSRLKLAYRYPRDERNDINILIGVHKEDIKKYDIQAIRLKENNK